ncbi:MAG: response regulator [Lachnospiraceae bacterium]
MHKIMIVDDNMANLIMAKKTLEDIYEVIPVSSGISALECLLDMPEPPDLVLLDVDMPNVNGFQVISEMKNVPKLENIPIVFLTAQDDDTTELESYNLGAVDYIKKPYTSLLLKKRVDIQIKLMEQQNKLKEFNDSLNGVVQDKSKKIVEMQYSIVEMCVELLGRRDGFSADHARRVERYMDVFFSEIIRSGKYEVNADDSITLCFASKIHDIGKMSIRDNVMIMPSNYMNEPEQMKVHTLLGADAIAKFANVQTGSGFFSFAYNMCRSHHEKWDGTGYPDKLAGMNIPFEARVLAIVNKYDIMRTRPVNGRIMSHQEAMVLINTMRGTFFEPMLVDIFMKCSPEIEKISVNNK